jgi:hypothetical protein
VVSNILPILTIIYIKKTLGENERFDEFDRVKNISKIRSDEWNTNLIKAVERGPEYSSLCKVWARRQKTYILISNFL